MAVAITVPRHVEGEDLVLVARPENDAEDILTRSEVSAATLYVYPVSGDAPNTALLTKTLAVTSDPDGSDDECMFATLQEDDTWDKEGGYTFWATVRDSELHLEGGQSYRVEVVLAAGHSTPAWPQRASYGELVFLWKVDVTPVASL